MKAIKVSIQEFKDKTKGYLEKYSEYMDKLEVINLAEKADIESMNGDTYHEKFEAWCKNYPESVKNYKQNREDLKKEYGEYSSYYNCPYYCLITNVKELNELYKDRMDDEYVKSENSSYNYHKRTIKKWVGKKVQNEIGDEVYGKCIGIAYFVDQDYWCILDEVTQQEYFSLHIAPFNIWDHRSYRIVENGKDYI